MHARFSLPRTSRSHSADMTAPLPAQQDSRFRRPGKLRIALVAVGAFLLAICLLLLFYIGPQLIAAPVSFNQTYILKATDASYFNAGTLQTVLGANLTYTLTVRSDPRSSSHTNAVWNSSAVLTDPVNKATVNVVVQRAAFNRRTEELLNCCGASLNGDTRVKQTGLGLLWPVDTNKGTHQVFDPNSGHAFPASYVRTVQVNGLTTYEFVQHVPPTVAQQMSGIPSSLLGLPGSSSSVVVADRYWSATNTFFVDPRTGIIINEEVKGQSVLRGPGGQGRLVVANMDLKMTQATQNQLVALANKNATSITVLRVVGPISTGILGVLLIAAAFLPFRRRSRAALTPQEGPKNEGLEMVAGSMHGVDSGPGNGAAAREAKDPGTVNGVKPRESEDGSPAASTAPRGSEDGSPAASTAPPETEDGRPAGTATSREGEERPD
jgi:hypothetical protein